MKTFVFRSSNFSFAIPGIIFLNIFVFILWMFSSGDESSFMARNFLVSWQGLGEGRIWTLLTSVYSHNSFLHIFLNMYVLKSFGPIVERVLGYRSFMRFYWGAGIVSSFTHAAVSAYFLNQPGLPALGASGSIAGLIVLFCLLFPKEKILILGLIPIPAMFGALLVIGLDIWGLSAQVGGHGLPIGHGAHLGGAFSGIFYYLFVMRRRTSNPKGPVHVGKTASGADIIDVKPL
jgi:membrane associated rhomboid family serine protease